MGSFTRFFNRIVAGIVRGIVARFPDFHPKAPVYAGFAAALRDRLIAWGLAPARGEAPVPTS